VGAYIYSHEDKTTDFVGALRFPGTELSFSSRLVTFVEFFGKANARPKVPFPAVKMAVGDIRSDQGVLYAERIIAEHHAWIPKYATIWTRASKSDQAGQVARLFPDDKTAMLIGVQHEGALIEGKESKEQLFPPIDKR